MFPCQYLCSPANTYVLQPVPMFLSQYLGFPASTYVPCYPCSHVPMFPDTLFHSTYVQKFLILPGTHLPQYLWFPISLFPSTYVPKPGTYVTWYIFSMVSIISNPCPLIPLFHSTYVQQYLNFPVPMLPGNHLPQYLLYVSQYLCSPVLMLEYLCSLVQCLHVNSVFSFCFVFCFLLKVDPKIFHNFQYTWENKGIGDRWQENIDMDRVIWLNSISLKSFSNIVSAGTTVIKVSCVH